ncbi:MAG TPA: VCBS repeat-containing protein [Blastocatellia bacterium]|nr:VCBS repeat-containing protein [Blastocatellia bacterium]
MRKNSALPLSLSIVILLIAQQMFTLHVPAQAFQGQSLAPSNDVTMMDSDSLIFDAVILDYDHPPFPAGTTVPLFGIMGGRGGSPEQGCPSIHYHSNPNVPSVRICRSSAADGIRPAIVVTEGPYRDQNPQGCGHGRIEKKQAALEIIAQGPSMAARGATVTYSAKVKNVGEVDFDGGSVRVILAFDGALYPIPNSFPLGAALRVGQEEVITVPLDLEGFEEDPDLGVGPFNVVDVDISALGLLKDCRDDLPQIDASVKLTTNVIQADIGPAPDIKREFGFGFNSTAGGFAVVPINSGNVAAGLAVLNNFKLTFLPGDMTGGYTIGVSPGIQGQIRNIIGGDFNGDGRTDIAGTDDQFRSVFASLQNGNGGFQPAISSSTQINFNRIAVADMNGDGILDIVGADASGMIQVIRGDGQGRFTSLFTTTSGLGRIDALATGDFNDDSFADVITGANNSAGGSQVGVLLNDPNGSLGPTQFFSFSGIATWVTAGDVNGDGIDEIIAASADTNTISIIDVTTGAVLNSFQSGGQNPVQVEPGNLNGDGGLDLAVANQGSNMVSIFLGTGTGEFFNALNIETPRPAGIRFADFNGDGNVDGQDFIVFRNFAQPPTPSAENLRAAEADPDSAGITVYLNGAEPVARAVVEQVERQGKHLIVTCTGCAAGARVLVDGVRKKTAQQADGRLRAKKAAKKIKAGQTAVVQVESEGKFSEWFIFTRQD